MVTKQRGQGEAARPGRHSSGRNARAIRRTYPRRDREMGQGRQGLGREGRLIVRRAYRQTGVTRTEILTATRRRDGRRRETGGRLLQGARPACRSPFVNNGNLAHRKSHVLLPRHRAFHRADPSPGRREPRRRVSRRARHVRPTDGSLLRTRGLRARPRRRVARLGPAGPDRKSTRLNSSHSSISYAVFCLKKKKKTTNLLTQENLDYQ